LTSERYTLISSSSRPFECANKFLLLDDRTGKRTVLRLKQRPTAALAFGAPWIPFQHEGDVLLYNINTGHTRAAACRKCGPDGPFAYALGTR
jgi:hypothetical protein